MTVVVRFNTQMFDVSRERPNPINPIAGESLLIWLREKFGAGHPVTEPDAEDWGWYAHVEWSGTKYLLGSSASEPEGGEREWVLQIVRSKSWKERIFGRGSATRSDPCVDHIVNLLSAEHAFHSLQVESAA